VYAHQLAHIRPGGLLQVAAVSKVLKCFRAKCSFWSAVIIA
jgi:hypothetical protein